MRYSNISLALSLALLAPTLADAAPARPNVVVFLLDNLGQEWLGCYGSEERCTPNIDALARDGVRFEHCYTTVVCGPSRTMLLTGRYPFRTGFTLHHDAALYSGGGLDPHREVVFARLFREAGYATGIAGKWQINNLYDEPDVLTRHGFDEQLVWPGSLDADLVSAAERRHFDEAIENNDVATTSEMIRRIESRYWNPVVLDHRGQRQRHEGKFGPDVFQEFAFDFIQRHREEPFLLYLPMVLTHGAVYQHPVTPTPLNTEDGRPHHEMFAEMVQYADQLIGQFVAQLDELGLRDNTLVLVATDNGTESSLVARRNGRDVPGGLYQLTEAGGDVGLLVNSPKLVPGGRTIELGDFTDVYPTICELAGIELPSDLLLDGHSHAAVLRGEEGARPAREWIFNQYGTRRVVRDARYKLYSTGEFYDVQADQAEEHNLAQRDNPRLAAAREKLEAVLAAMPPDNSPPFELRSQSAFKLRSEQAAAAAAEGGQGARRPNIVYIMVDDMGVYDLGCYGQQHIETPNVDRLARQGMRFTQCYAGSAVCAPSRSVLMTGQHTGHTRVRGNAGMVGGVGPQRRVPLEPEDVTVAEVLQEAGYVTGITGKWGLGEPDTTGVPNRQGFDEWFGYLNQRHAHGYYPEYLWRNETKVDLPGNQGGKREQYSHDLMTDFALDFVRKHHAEPFFLYLAWTVPHQKYEIPSLEPYADKPWSDDAKCHAAMITRADRDVGRLLALLEQFNIAEETIVFFTSDNGGWQRWEGVFDSHGPLRGAKGDAWEGGLRTPMVVRWPGHVPAGKTSDAPWYFADFLPTATELGGGKLPDNIDGVSVLPTLLGNSQPELNQRPMYWELPFGGFRQAGRIGQWKAVRHKPGGPIELYDLSRDVGETQNVADEHAEMVARFEKLFTESRTESPNWPMREKVQSREARVQSGR